MRIYIGPRLKDVVAEQVARLVRAIHAHDGGLHRQLLEDMGQRTRFSVFLLLVDKPF
ncbi:MAG TPA: hypothetical protein VGB27_04705 [Candidatus Binatia bacterium]